MDIKYDILADAVYVKVNAGKVANTIKTDEKVLVDVDEHGNVIGIEILDASSQQGLVSNLQNNIERGVPVTIQNETPTVA